MQNARQNSGSELKNISSVSNISDLRSFLNSEIDPATQHSPSVTDDLLTTLTRVAGSKSLTSSVDASLIQTQSPSMALDPLVRLSDNLDRLEDMHKKLSFVMHEIRYSLKVK